MAQETVTIHAIVETWKGCVESVTGFGTLKDRDMAWSTMDREKRERCEKVTVTAVMDRRPDPENYQGWSNRETWAYALWIANEESIYDDVINKAKEIIEEHPESLSDCVYELSQYLKNYLDEIRDEVHNGAPTDTILEDIGSEWRIDYREIAENEISDLWAQWVKIRERKTESVKKLEEELKGLAFSEERAQSKAELEGVRERVDQIEEELDRWSDLTPWNMDEWD